MSQEKKNSNILNPVRIEIKPSKLVKGEVGLFATRAIKKDSVIVPDSHFSDMQFIPWKDFDKFDRTTKRKIVDFCIGDNGGFWAPRDLNYISIAWHINHSCNPNIGFNSKADFVAMRNIKKGEELTWDYGFGESNPNFRMVCKCGTKKCRKLITGNDWKNLILNQKFYKYMLPNLKK